MTPAQQSILTRLERGPASMLELVMVTGCDRGSVSVDLCRLAAHGHVIENCRRAGSFGGGLYRLRTGPRRCQMPGCITLLPASNPGMYCRRHVAGEAQLLDLLIGALAKDVGVDPGAAPTGQLEMVGR